MARSPSSTRAAAIGAQTPQPLLPLTLGGDLTVGVAGSLVIGGPRAGSTLAATGLPSGMTLNSAARSITGTPRAAGTYNVTITETLAGAAGSPKATALTLNVAAAPVAKAVAPADALKAAGFDAVKAADLAAALPAAASLGIVTVPHVAIIGDSITNPDFNGADRTQSPLPSPTNYLKAANGILAWALILSGQRVRAPANTNVWAFPGQETGTILANLPAFIDQMPSLPGAVVVECGTNNVYHPGPTATFEAITADWLSIATYLTQRGIRTIFVPILPRIGGSGYFSTVLSNGQYDTIDRCNRWLNGLAQRSGGMIAVASTTLADLTDPSAAGAKPKGLSMYDGTHPGVLGAYYAGKGIAAIFRDWFPPLDLLPTNNLTWASDIPRGNLLANGMMQGGGGTVSTPSSGTIAGTAPTSWTMMMTNTAGLTVTGSQVTSAVSGWPMHQMAFSGSYTVSGSSGGPTYAHYARLSQLPGNVAQSIQIGDTVEALIAFEIDAGNTCISFPQLNFRWGNSAGFNTDGQQAPRDLPSEAISGVLRTAPHFFSAQPAAGDVGVLAYAYLKSNPDGAVTANATIRFGRAVLQKVDAA